MKASSPPVAIYKTPLKGMDTRAVKSEDAPNLLLNVDLSNRGYWKERPGVRLFASSTLSTLPNNSKIMGVYSFRIDGHFYLFVISAQTVTLTVKKMWLSLLDGTGALLTGSYNIGTTSGVLPNTDIPNEPFDDEHMYSFIKAGRFVYFCNGYGNLYEAEFETPLNWKFRSMPLDVGLNPLTKSYVTGGLKPSSITYFSEKVYFSGFKFTKSVGLSLVADNNSEGGVPSQETLNQQRTVLSVDPSTTLASEKRYWRAFSIEDANSNFWVYNDVIVSARGLGTDLFLFGNKYLHKVLGPESDQPQVLKLAELSSVGPHAQCYFDRYILFVALDGIYITDGQSVQKVSYEMDALWFGREEPQTTRSIGNRLKGTAYPFHANRKRLSKVCCVNDKLRQQVMISLPSEGFQNNNMCWVYNYSDLLEGVGQGKWSIWSSGSEPAYTGTSLDSGPFAGDTGGGPTKNNPATSPTQSNTTYNVLHWTSVTDDIHNGDQRIFAGTDTGEVYEFGVSKQDLRAVATYDMDGDATGADTPVAFPVAISLGRVGKVDSDGRIVCTDIAVRRKQFNKNIEDESTVGALTATVRSEGEGLKYFDTSETDVEFSDRMLNSQQGFSENTKSTLNTMVLGASPTGSNAPLMQSEYFETYARVNVPDEEGRAAYVDLYSNPSTAPHRLQISEVRVYANIKGGSQREQS